MGDDCALADRGLNIAGRRGIAGTVMVHKIAGAAAEAGKSLKEVAAAASAAAAAVGSMGVALRSCTLPGQPRSEERIADGMMEVGLGIHGESGAMVAPLGKVDEIVASLLSYITSQVSTQPPSMCLHLPAKELIATPSQCWSATPVSFPHHALLARAGGGL